MAEYMHLVGAEQVQIAANTIRTAASEMNRAANTISEALSSNERLIRELLDKLNYLEEKGKL